ncbi:MAG: hypothetical protein CVV02_14760 [Firmicutes bacterium HGW-Firmicutes-7]|nr:MAG: hypothetical protein CVV02_14760 [Firmicutes bacterium HGW-Firmicutes-7]
MSGHQLPKVKEAADAKAVLRKAYELGVNHFDTADFYGNGIANRYLASVQNQSKEDLFRCFGWMLSKHLRDWEP